MSDLTHALDWTMLCTQLLVRTTLAIVEDNNLVNRYSKGEGETFPEKQFFRVEKYIQDALDKSFKKQGLS